MRIQLIDLERYGGPRGSAGIEISERFIFHKGGGGSAPAPVATPPPPAPVLTMPAPASPPVTTSAIEVTQARLDAKRQAKNRKGINSTILAEPAPSTLGSTPAGKNTLLGGG